MNCCGWILTVFFSNVSRSTHNWHQWNHEGIEQEIWTSDINFSFRLEQVSSYLKRPCWFFREQLTWLMSLRWVREGYISHWGTRNDQDHRQDLYKLPYIKGNQERSWISLHTLGATEISVSLKKKFEEIASEVKEKLPFSKRMYWPVLSRIAVHYPTEYGISQWFQKCSLIQRSWAPINL